MANGGGGGETIRDVVFRLRMETIQPDTSKFQLGPATEQVKKFGETAANVAQKAKREFSTVGTEMEKVGGASLRLGQQFSQVGQNVARFAQGLAFLAASNKETAEEILRLVVRIRGFFDIVAGGLKTITSLVQLYQGLGAALRAAAAAQAALNVAQLSGLAAGGTAAGGAAAGGTGRLIAAGVGGAALSRFGTLRLAAMNILGRAAPAAAAGGQLAGAVGAGVYLGTGIHRLLGTAAGQGVEQDPWGMLMGARYAAFGGAETAGTAQAQTAIARRFQAFQTQFGAVSQQEGALAQMRGRLVSGQISAAEAGGGTRQALNIAQAELNAARRAGRDIQPGGTGADFAARMASSREREAQALQEVIRLQTRVRDEEQRSFSERIRASQQEQKNAEQRLQIAQRERETLLSARERFALMGPLQQQGILETAGRLQRGTATGQDVERLNPFRGLFGPNTEALLQQQLGRMAGPRFEQFMGMVGRPGGLAGVQRRIETERTAVAAARQEQANLQHAAGVAGRNMAEIIQDVFTELLGVFRQDMQAFLAQQRSMQINQQAAQAGAVGR